MHVTLLAVLLDFSDVVLIFLLFVYDALVSDYFVAGF